VFVWQCGKAKFFFVCVLGCFLDLGLASVAG